jgi:predicted HTH domain antitoxin
MNLETGFMENLFEAEMDALVESKVYPNRNELIHDAFKALLRAKPNLRIESAIRLYLKGQVSLSSAAELAGFCAEEMKNIMAERVIHRDAVISSEVTIQKAQKFLHAE